MRDKAVFAGVSLAVSFALFGIVAALRANHYYTPLNVGFVLPAAAVMIAALGASWRRKLVAIAIMLGAYTAVDALAVVTGFQAAVARPHGTDSAGELVGLAVIAYSLVPMIFPLAALAIFVGRDPSMLWTPKAQGGKRRVR